MDEVNVRWPNFLGIGVPKAGTTWLYKLADGHPQIWVPEYQREVHYFDRYYESRSVDWYGEFFPEYSDTSYKAVGEITPHYFYCSSARIKDISSALPSADKFILILRNPVDRLYSAFWFKKRTHNIKASFRDFVEENDTEIDRGFYAKYLKRWLEHFDLSQFLILTTESDLTSPEPTRRRVAEFLNANPNNFPEDAGKSKSNTRYLPRFRNAYALALALRRQFRRLDIQWPQRIARRLGVKHWFGKRKVEKNMNKKVRKELHNLYYDDMEELRQIVNRDLSEW